MEHVYTERDIRTMGILMLTAVPINPNKSVSRIGF